MSRDVFEDAPTGGGGFAPQPNGAFGDPTVAPSFMGYFPNANDLLILDTTGMKQGCWAIAGDPNADQGPFLWPSIFVLDTDSGTFEQITMELSVLRTALGL